MQGTTRWGFLALTALVALCVPRVSYAQQMNFSYYSDYYYSDDGSTLYTVVDGFDNSTGCTHYDYQTTGYAYAPSGNYSQSSGGLSSYVGIPVGAGNFNFSWGSDVVVNCSCFGPGLGAGGGSGSSSVLPVPSGEYSIALPNNWAPYPYDTIFRWWAQLTSTTGDSFTGRTLREQSGGGIVDTCYDAYPNPVVGRMSAANLNGVWTANGSNQYGTDDVGDADAAVDYYRNHATSTSPPCRWEIWQKMQIDQIGGRWVTYKTNRLKFGIDPNGVWSYRDGTPCPGQGPDACWKAY